MINVTFTETPQKLSLRVEGHAGYAEQGKDIVCASASILAYTVAQYVMEAEHNGDLASPPEMKLELGDTFISCEPQENVWKTMQDVFSFAKMGYIVLEYNYQQYVRLIES